MVVPEKRVIAAGAIALAAMAGSCGGDGKKTDAPAQPSGLRSVVRAAVTPPLVCTAPPPAPSSWVNPDGAPISGTVVDDRTGEPLGRAKVTLNDGTTTFAIESDEKGRFELDAPSSRESPLAPTEYEVTGNCRRVPPSGRSDGVTVFAHRKRNAPVGPLAEPGPDAPRPSGAPKAASSKPFSRAELEQALRYSEGLTTKKPARFLEMQTVFEELQPVKAGSLGCGLVSPLRDAIADGANDPKPSKRELGPETKPTTFSTTHFVIKYATQGDDAPKLYPKANYFLMRSDGRTPMALEILSTNKTQEVVQVVAAIAEDAWSRLMGKKDLIPRTLTKPIEIQLMGLPKRTGVANPAWDHIVINVGNESKVNKVIVPHEIFHWVQFMHGCKRHDGSTPATECYARARGLRDMFLEGAAMVAEDGIDDGYNCYGAFALGAFQQPDRSLASLDENGDGKLDNDTAAYRAGIFWKYFVEQCANHSGGEKDALPYIEELQHVFDAVGKGGLEALSTTTCREGKLTFKGLFADHFTSAYLASMPTIVPEPKERYTYEEQRAEPHCATHANDKPLSGQPFHLMAHEALEPGSRVICKGIVEPWSARVVQVDLEPAGSCESTVSLTAPQCSVRIVTQTGDRAEIATTAQVVVAPSGSAAQSVGLVVACHDAKANEAVYEVARSMP